ncbi:hypothetical protein OSTOST_07834, partial [Ostertagia ostertagi]
MRELWKKLSGCKERLETATVLSQEQKEFLKGLKPCTETSSCEKITLTREQQHEVIADIDSSRSRRQAYNDKTYPGRRWSRGVFYSLDGSLTDDLLLVFKEHGCWAEVGRQEGWQLLSLGKDCDTVVFEVIPTSCKAR